jgi:glucose/arabinose dehydrogenase
MRISTPVPMFLIRFAPLIACCALACAVGCNQQDGAAQQSAGAAADDDKPTPGLPTVYLTPAFPRLSFARPVFLTHTGDGSNRLFVVEQTGRVRVFENQHDVQAADVFLDIRERVQMNHNEEGLLAVAFHPKYKDNGRFFIYYTVKSARGEPKRNRVAEYRVDPHDANKADAASERVILDVEQKWGNHNGSTLLFGPDGCLYISHGDGGSANDPDGNGQNLRTLLGKITRIDIDKQDEGKAYAIPPDNPFIDQAKFPGARPEIWAYGLRNVWRMSFDRVTGNLWAGDVGQNEWEEIDLIVKGGNYGWNIREGKHDFAGGRAGSELIEPLAEYSHRQGLSVTGGYVYRGEKYPALDGVYLYADYATGRVWGLKYQDGKVTANGEVLGGRERTFIASFGEGEAGEMYVCAFDRMDGRSGRIMRVTGR